MNLVASPLIPGAGADPRVTSFNASTGSFLSFPPDVFGLFCPLPVLLCAADGAAATDGVAECDFEFRPDGTREPEAWL